MGKQETTNAWFLDGISLLPQLQRQSIGSISLRDRRHTRVAQSQMKFVGQIFAMSRIPFCWKAAKHLKRLAIL
jgi:hypothetical protein